MIDLIVLFVFLIRLSLITTVFMLTLQKFLQFRQQTWLFLLYSTFSFLLGEIISFFTSSFIINQNIIPEQIRYESFTLLVQSSVPIFISILVSGNIALGLVFFLQAYETDQILTIKNSLFLVILSVISIGSLVTMTSFVHYYNEIAPSITTQASFNKFLFQNFALLLYMTLFLISGLIFIFILLSDLFMTIRSYKKKTNSNEIKSVLLHLQIAIVTIFLGNLFKYSNSLDLGGLLALLAYSWFVYQYLSSNLYTIHGSRLKKILLVNNASGLPFFNFEFHLQDTTSNESINPQDSELLFSGALKATSTILADYTNSVEQNVQEIKYKNIIIMIKDIPKTNFSFVLLTEESTKVFRQSLDTLSSQTSKITELNDKMMNLTDKEVKSINDLVTSSFGFGYKKSIF